MPFDLRRLVAGCQRNLLERLIDQLKPEKKPAIDWSVTDRGLANVLSQAFSSDGSVWPHLQNVASLADHGGRSVVRSVLFRDTKLREDFDDLDASDETAAAWLAVVSDAHFQFALSALHADRGLRKRSWRAYRVPFSADAVLKFDKDSLTHFEARIREAIDRSRYLDQPGRLEVHHFSRVVFPEHSHSPRDQDQVTVYAEMRNITEEVFNDEDELVTRRRKKIDQISVVFDRARRELDVITIGGRDFIMIVAHAFCECFSNELPKLEQLVRRPVNLQMLARKPPFSLEGQNLVERARVDEIRVRSPTGYLFTLERKSREPGADDVYAAAEREFGGRSPFVNEGWTVESARICLTMVPTKVGHGPKIRAVELKPDGRTNLREHEDNDRFIANELLVRWGILEPAADGDD